MLRQNPSFPSVQLPSPSPGGEGWDEGRQTERTIDLGRVHNVKRFEKPNLRPVAPLVPKEREKRAVRVLPFGDQAVDAHLPGGGLPLGAMHEIQADGIERELGAVGGAFAATLLARMPAGPILWVATLCDLYAPGLLAFGLDPGRIVSVQAQDDAEALGTMEVALREGGVSAVLGEVATLGRLPGRRLHFACLKHGVTALVLRRAPYGAGSARSQRDGMAATTRWRVGPAPSQAEDREPGPPRWQVDLVHARGGREGSWLMEVGDAPGALRVVSKLGDGTAALERTARQKL